MANSYVQNNVATNTRAVLYTDSCAGFGNRSTVVLPPEATIRVGEVLTTTEELERFIKIMRRVTEDMYPEELL